MLLSYSKFLLSHSLSSGSSREIKISCEFFFFFFPVSFVLHS